MVRPHVVVYIILERRERRHAGTPNETHVVAAPDVPAHVAPGADVLQLLEPRIEDGLGLVVLLHVKTVDRSLPDVLVEVHGELLPRLAIRIAFEMTRYPLPRPVEALFLAAPNAHADRAPRVGTDSLQDAHGLDGRRDAVGIIGASRPRMP